MKGNKIPSRIRRRKPYKAFYSRWVRASFYLPLPLLIPSILVAAYWLHCFTSGYPSGGVYLKDAPLSRAFDGDVKDLRRTIIVSTLETPMPPHRNVIWTASAALQWRSLIGEPFEKMSRARDRGRDTCRDPKAYDEQTRLADLANAAQGNYGITADDYYTYLGSPAETMASNPWDTWHESVPSSIVQSPGAFSNSYLRLNVAFPLRMPNDIFIDWKFRDSLGHERQGISHFGFWMNTLWEARLLSINPAFSFNPGRFPPDTPLGWVIDPCPDSYPYQIILAQVRKRSSLAETIAYTQDLIDKFDKEHSGKIYRANYLDLSLPRLFFRIINHSKIPDYFHASQTQATGSAEQIVAVELNAANKDNARRPRISPANEQFSYGLRGRAHATKPFLIQIYKRGFSDPVFVMWNDNDELLSPKPPWWPSILHLFW